MGVQMQLAAVGLSVLGAVQARSAANMEAQAYKEQAELAKLKADQDEISRNNQLRYQLAALGTSMASQGVSLGTSASVSAISKREKELAAQDVSNIKLMGMSQRRNYQISAEGAKASGKAKFLGGLAQAGSMAYSIDKGVGKGAGR
tara:strand:+ start:402 stop:839 length:438 start_codon:yes stop_codon:yes gene_type:complete